jgi:hypothetical protein
VDAHTMIDWSIAAVQDQFVDVNTMIDIGSGAQREVSFHTPRANPTNTPESPQIQR